MYTYTYIFRNVQTDEFSGYYLSPANAECVASSILKLWRKIIYIKDSLRMIMEFIKCLELS